MSGQSCTQTDKYDNSLENYFLIGWLLKQLTNRPVTKVKHFSTLQEYCRGINIAPPRNAHFDIRSFEENMKTVRPKMEPFKHEFYAIALKLEGGGFTTTGSYNTKDTGVTIFFNSPYQIIHWNIAPDWKGYYIMFTEDFYRRAGSQKRITEQYPFLLSDNTFPLSVAPDQAELFYKTFADIYFEHQSRLPHQEDIIFHYVNILLLKTARLYYKHPKSENYTTEQRDSDLTIVSRFKTLIETSFYPHQVYKQLTPHQVQFYAEKMNLHPNHLNAVVKRITDSPASKLIQQHVLSLAKSKLQSTDASVKEIAYGLYFSYPNHFSTFIKKQAGMTPTAYRKQ